MRKLISRAAMLAAVAALSLPAIAGNYAEGDPRPAARAAVASPSAVFVETKSWLSGAPTVGYPEGNPRDVLSAGQVSRGAVVADTMTWMRSGLASYANGERGMDPAQPGFRNAARSYALMRDASGAVAIQQPAGAGTIR